MTINKPAGRVDYLAFFLRSCLLQGLQIKLCVDTVMCKKGDLSGQGLIWDLWKNMIIILR